MKGRLFRIPLNLDEWNARTADLPTEDVGALLRAVAWAWDAPTRGHPPATIRDDDDVLERILGARWRKMGWEPVIRAHFKPHDDLPDRFLRCEWLLDWYNNAKKAHDIAAAKGQAGGRKRGENYRDRRSSASSSASTSAKAGGQASKAKGVFTHTTPARTRGEDQLPQRISADEVQRLGEQWRAVVGPKEVVT